MECKKIYLKEYFDFLGDDGCNAYVECIFPFSSVRRGENYKKHPSVIVCPGGGYGGLVDWEAEPIGLNYLSAGYNVFVLYYSVAPHRFPQQLREVAALMEIIYENADEWGCDTEKIAIMGFSAGGHLAAHYSTMYDCNEVRAVFPESKSVNASVLCYPVISAYPEKGHMGSFKNLLGHEPMDENERSYFSCECNVKDTTPPAFIWHTAEDESVPVENSLLYASALAEHKIVFALRIYPFGPHGLATADDQTNNKLNPRLRKAHLWIKDSIEWLEMIFGLD